MPLLIRRVIRSIAILGLCASFIVSGLHGLPWVKAAGSYDNAAIADKALTYYNGSNVKRAKAAPACNEARKPGDVGGQCRAFVNCVVWLVSGKTQNLGGDYFQSFTKAGGDEVRSADNLRKGDIVQEGNGRHTSIVVSRVHSNQFMVVDSNHWGDETVGYYQRTINLGGDVRAFRMGTLPPANQAPFGSLEMAVAVPGGLRVAGWSIDADSPSPVEVHAYSGSGLPGQGNPGVAARADVYRPDVDQAFRRGPSRGYDMIVPVSGAPRQRVCVYAINMPGGANPAIGCAEVGGLNVPFGSLDLVERVGDSVRLAGWTIDPDMAAPLEVHVYGGSGSPGGGNPGWALRADTDRADVGQVFPAYGSLHGYDTWLPAGTTGQTFCAYAINDRAGLHPLIGCQRI